MAHVLARLSGRGSIILPRAPYRLSRIEAAHPTVCAEHRTASATLTFAPTLDIQLGSNTSSLDAVCDVSRGEFVGDFIIETSLFSIAWPTGFDVVGGIEEGPSAFDLVSDTQLIYVQGPFDPQRLRTIDRMAAPGQHVAGTGRAVYGEWIDLEYLHEGTPHSQRHIVLAGPRRTFVVTAQSPSVRAPVVRVAADLVATTFRPTV